MRHALALAAILLAQTSAPAVRLQIRVFDGGDEVTAETRVTLFRAGDRQQSVADSRQPATLDTSVPAGMYDAQAIREKDGRVVSIRWAERLVVMPYPDEEGLHLEIINFKTEFGALEVKGETGGRPELALFPAGERATEAGRPLTTPEYVLFVVPAGKYDLRATRSGTIAWHTAIDVPRDRTRFWVVR
jgi:hypothetical protein